MRYFLLISLVLVLSTSAVQAGFEWRGNPEMPTALVEDDVSQNDIIKWDPPVVEEQQVIDVAPVESNPVVIVPEVPAAGTVVESVVVTVGAPAAPAAPVVVENEPVLSGFGTDLPLVVALQQILPPKQKYAFARDVNPAQKVSWQGGKTWREVLADSLKVAGLEFRVQNNIVAIGSLRIEQPTPAAQEQGAQEQAVVIAPVVEQVAEQNRAALIPQDMMIQSASTQEASVQSVAPAQVAPAPISIRRVRPTVSRPQVQQENVVISPVVKTDVQAEKLNTTETKPSMVVGDVWNAKSGDTLRSTLKRWSSSASVDMFWSTDFDYRLTNDSNYVGNFSDAVKNLLDQFAHVTPQPYGQLHQDGQNPKMLIIRAYDDNALNG